MAFIHDEMLVEPEAAIRVYAEILELDPDEPHGADRARFAVRASEMWSDLADNVSRQLSLADDDADAGRVDAAAGPVARDAHERAGSGDRDLPRGARARSEQCRGVRERSSACSRCPEHQLQIAEILEPLYRDSNEFEKLIGIHDIQVQNSSSADQRVELLHRMAELYEVALDDLDSAFRTFARALARGSEQPDARASELDRIAASAGAWQALAEVYETQAQSASEDPAVLVLAAHARPRRSAKSTSATSPSAIAHYKRVLEVDRDESRCGHCARAAVPGRGALRGPGEDLPDEGRAAAGRLTEQKEYLFRAGAHLRGGAGAARRRDRRVRSRARSSTPRTCGALDKLIAAAPAPAPTGRSCSRSTGSKADVVADPDEKKAPLPRDRRGLRARAAARRRRPSRPTSACWSSIPTT